MIQVLCVGKSAILGRLEFKARRNTINRDYRRIFRVHDGSILIWEIGLGVW